MKEKKPKKKNKPLLRLINYALHDDSWKRGSTTKFARLLSEKLNKNVCRATVHNWLTGKGLPHKYVLLGEKLSDGTIKAEEFRKNG